MNPPIIPVDIAAAKSQLRQTLLEQRDAYAEHEREKENQRLTTKLSKLLSASTISSVCVYVSTRDEVGTHELIDELIAQEITVAVPKLISREEMVAVRFPGWSEMHEGALGILSPRTAIPIAPSPQAAIVPGLGFSRDGTRLGFGAGYYDRWLCARRCLKIGVGFDFQLIDSIPAESHDVPMDIVVTPTATFDLRSD